MDITLKDFGVERREKFLNNGMKLVILNKPNSPVYMRITFEAGSKYNPEQKEGVAHFLEHMLVAGTKTYPTKDKLAMYIEQYGGEFGAATSAEELFINVMIPDFEDMEVGINVLSEILTQPLFDPKTFETERGAIIQELKGKKSKPDQMLWELYPYTFLRGSSLGRTTLGTEETIKNITLEDVKEFYTKYIVSNRATIIIAGDIDEERLIELIEKKITLNSGKAPIIKDEVKINDNGDNNILIENNYSGDFLHFLFGFRFTGQDPLENCISDILCNSLANGRGATLAKKLRYEKGLVYGLGMLSFVNQDLGSMIFKSSVERKNIDEVFNILVSEFKNIKANGLENDNLKSTQQRIKKGLKLRFETSQSWVSMYTDWERGVGAPLGIEEYIKTVSNVTNEDIKKFANKYFNKDNWYLAICGDIKKEDITINI